MAKIYCFFPIILSKEYKSSLITIFSRSFDPILRKSLPCFVNFELIKIIELIFYFFQISSLKVSQMLVPCMYWNSTLAYIKVPSLVTVLKSLSFEDCIIISYTYQRSIRIIFGYSSCLV